MGKFGLGEMAQSLKEEACPIPLMRVAAAKATLVLTTYPYLLNDHWKASVFGKAESRKLCLPIIDEAHNIIEMMTKAPALTLHLTTELEAGQGLDVTGNVYYLASLVDDLKHGYRRTILGYLGSLFAGDKNERNSQQAQRIKEIKDARARRREMLDQARKVREAFSEFRSAVATLKRAEDPGLDADSPWLEQASHVRGLFQIASEERKRNKHQMEAHRAACDRHKKLCKESSRLKRLRNELQAGARGIRKQRDAATGMLRDSLHEAAMRKNDEATKHHDAMMANSDVIDGLQDEICRLRVAVDSSGNDQNQAWGRATQALQGIFDARNRDEAERRDAIEALSSQIDGMQADIDRRSEQAREVARVWTQVESAIRSDQASDDLLRQFYLTIGTKEESWPMEMLRSAFSLFEFLCALRDALRDLLSDHRHGPMRDVALAGLLADLDERLFQSGGAGIRAFYARCHDAIEQFEGAMALGEGSWNGVPLYGLHQMFRVFVRICDEPYSFAAFVQKHDVTTISFHALDPATRFRDVWHDLRPPLLASATVSPVTDVAEVLGLGNGLKAKMTPVFPVENYQSYALIGLHSAGGQDPRAPVFSTTETNILEQTIGPILAATRVHTGLFCASHRVLDHVSRVVTKDYAERYGLKLLVGRSDSQAVDDHFEDLRGRVAAEHLEGLGEFDARLRVFQEVAGDCPTVLCGVSGGGFGEGVDFRGNMMELAVIIGIPYEGEGDAGWLNNLRTALFKMRRGDEEVGKDLAYRQSAIRKIAQSAGRVHRGTTERGAIVMMDERLLGLKNTGDTKPYEILSADNARGHWDILQERVFESLQIVIPPVSLDESLGDAEALVYRVFRRDERLPKVIDFDQMMQSLEDFYR